MNFGGIIGEWYKKNKRELPWRLTRDPYRIWLSEVILQQTRVNQGLQYYNAFVQAFPDVHALAAASEEKVLRLWQGLGYYTRARNLLHTARVVSNEMGGHFPDTFEGLNGLKGVGEYTASAIASICYGEARAVVDGNVSRVIARLYGVEEAINSKPGEKIIRDLAGNLLMEEGGTDPGVHNQAMMEFGALQCVPLSPDCGSCPAGAYCAAFGSGRVDELPLKRPKKKPVHRWMYFFVIVSGGRVLLEKRGNRDIWRSLYHFPALESPVPLKPAQLYSNKILEALAIPGNAGSTLVKEPSQEVLHLLSHRTIHAAFIPVRIKDLPHTLPQGWVAVDADRLDSYPVPRLMERYMQSVNFSYL